MRARVGALLALVLALACAPNEPTVVIRDARVVVDLARTPAEQALGLGGRRSLDWDRGMLFLYDEPGFYSFWMKGMNFDIDIVWIRDDRIVDITPGVRHDLTPPLPSYAPRELVDRVLEVPSGYALAHGWLVGDPVRIELP